MPDLKDIYRVRILIVEDEERVAKVLCKGLEAEGFAVDVAHDGEAGVCAALETNYDLILLDMVLPKLDGFAALQKLRQRGIESRILILSLRAAVADRVRGLKLGADDYLNKPFSFDELLARIHVLLRRPARLQSELRVADLEIDHNFRRVRRAGRNIVLTPKEYAVLEYLMRNVGRPVTRTMICEHVWNSGFDGLTNIVDVYINYLRQKVDASFPKKLIHTARGVGYTLMDPDEAGKDNGTSDAA